MEKRIDSNRITQIQRFGHKIAKKADALLQAPSYDDLAEFKKIFNEYLCEISLDYALFITQMEIKVKEDLAAKALEIAKNSILVSTRENSPSSNPRIARVLKPGEEDAIIRDASILAGISAPSVVSIGVTRGSRRASENVTLTTQLLHQKVSTLRRILYWQNIDDTTAERMVDAIILKAGVSGFTKYQRRKNYIYKPIIKK
jgi:hypothetical protein